uniref:Odorant receptor n=1 Tax=Ctenopseustis herana TaxID=65029 RepID=A0A097ITU7_9NEOP|nr:olfactory receptor 38 [Ctenopseustis herana]
MLLYYPEVDWTGISPLTYLFTLVTFGFYFYAYNLSTIWFIYFHAESDLLFCILILSLSISSHIGVIKMLYMYVNSQKLRGIVADYLICDAAILPGSRLDNNIKVTLRKVKKRAAIYWLIIIGNGIVYMVVPLLTPGRHITEDEQILWGLDPTLESPNYEITTIILWFAVGLTVYAPANITGFLIIIVGYTEAQMLALSEELLYLWDDAQNHCRKIIAEGGNIPMEASSSSKTNFFSRRSKDSGIFGGPSFKDNATTAPSAASVQEKIINDFIKQRLVRIAKMHAVNINLIIRIENIFEYAMAFEFTLLSAGLIAELLGGLENTYDEVPFALAQVAMDCITGQKLIDANAVFADAVYGCKWENFDVSNMKLALVMLQNAQKTMKLSALGIKYLDYSTLMSVIKSIYSAYTTLRSTMNI